MKNNCKKDWDVRFQKLLEKLQGPISVRGGIHTQDGYMQVRIALDKHKTLSDLKQYCFNVLRVLCIQAISLSEGPFSFCMHLVVKIASSLFFLRSNIPKNV